MCVCVCMYVCIYVCLLLILSDVTVVLCVSAAESSVAPVSVMYGAR